MPAVWYRFRAELRVRWRAWLGLAFLVGLAGGIVLTAVAGARRTDSAYDRFVEESKAWDVLVNPDIGNESALSGMEEQLRALPNVRSLGRVNGMVAVPEGATPNEIGGVIELAPSDERMFNEYFRPNVLEGRLPDPAQVGEVAVDPQYARAFDVSPGDTYTAYAFDPAGLQEQYSSEDEAFAALRQGEVGTAVDLTITGVVTTPETVVVDEGFEAGYVLMTHAFLVAHPDALAGFFGYDVALEHGAADELELRHAIEALVPDETVEFQSRALIDQTVHRAVRPYTVALWAFALAVGITAVLVLAQAIARQRFLDAVDDAALVAMGCTRLQLLGLSLARAVPVAAIGAAIAVVITIAASPLMPIGVAGRAELHPGLSVDGLTIGLGSLGIVVLVGALTLFAARRLLVTSRTAADERAPRVSLLSAVFARVGARPSAATGVRFASESGRGRTAVPARTTLTTSVVAVATVLAALTFAAGLDRLVHTPRLYGNTWQFGVETDRASEEEVAQAESALTDALAADPAIDAWSRLTGSHVELEDESVPAVAFVPLHGKVLPAVAAGRLPAADDEVALGKRTLDHLGVSVGDSVTATFRGKAHQIRVVGRVVLPGLGNYAGGDKTSPGDGALFTESGLARVSPPFVGNTYVVQVEGGADGGAVQARIADRLDPETFRVVGVEARRPADVVDLDRVRATPIVLAGMLALLGAATIAHALVTTIRRRRRDLALLKTLGFTRRQVSGAIAWQASTIGVVAAFVGTPVGVAAGRWAWSLLARSIGFLAEPAVAWLAVLLALPVLLLGANLAAFVPGLIAARTKPAVVLRTE